MKYFYHDRNGELHGPAELDFLACEVKWGGLPDHLMIRPVDGEEWVALAEAVKRETGTGFYPNVMSVPPEEVAGLSFWKRLRYYYRRSWRMAFVFSGRASRRECLSVFLSMTLADCLGLAVAQILLGLALPLLMPGVDVFSCLSFISRFLGLLLVLLIVLQSFALCWRRLHDLSLAGWWSFALPFVFLAGSLSVEWFLGHLFRSDTWGHVRGTCGRCWSNGGRRNGGGSFRVVRNLGCYAAGPVSRYEEGKSIRSSSGGMTVPFPGQRRTGDFPFAGKGG